MYSVKLEWKEFNVDLASMEAWVKALEPSCVGNSADTSLTFWFTEDVNQGEDSVAAQIQAKWDSIEADSAEAVLYTQKATLAVVKKQVQNIAAFSADLLNQFAAENIAMGITQDNKTEDVLDTMLPVMNALQGGAPTIAIKRAKAISPSAYDSKYVTAARLLAYVNKIEAFLGLSQSSSLS